MVLKRSFGAPLITKDGVSVAKEIELPDEFENMGAMLVREVASKTPTSQATAPLPRRFCRSYLDRRHESGCRRHESMDLKRGIDKAVSVAIEALKKLSKPCRDGTAIAQVGTISANADAAVGNIIAEAMDKVGKEGVITVEDGNGLENELLTVEGMQFDRGYISPYFVNNQQNMSCELDQPAILLVDKKISNIREMLPILEGGRKIRSFFVDHCRRRRRRSFSDLGREQHSRSSSCRCGQSPWVWRSSKSYVARHRDFDRW